MQPRRMARWLVVCGLVMAVGLEVAAKDPMFMRWMVAEDPGDAAILYYWQRAERGELSAQGLVDLGTMLFYRGFPSDAVRTFKKALDVDSKLEEAWFRIGLVHQREGKLREARQAYQRCLKIRPGHGWGNFYLGLLEERDNNPSVALKHYQTAFRHAPELADPAVNPEVLYSKLQLGAAIPLARERAITRSAPFDWLEPAEVEATRGRFQPAPAPTPTAPPPTAAAATPTMVRPAPPGGMVGGAPTGDGGTAAGVRAGDQRVRPGSQADGVQVATPTARGVGGEAGVEVPSYLHIPEVSPEASLRTPGHHRGGAA